MGELAEWMRGLQHVSCGAWFVEVLSAIVVWLVYSTLDFFNCCQMAAVSAAVSKWIMLVRFVGSSGFAVYVKRKAEIQSLALAGGVILVVRTIDYALIIVWTFFAKDFAHALLFLRG